MNSIQHRNRFTKEKQLKEEMRKLLAQNENGIDSEKFIRKVGEATGVSRGTIYKMVKEFTNVTGEMRIERNRKDMRKASYFPNVEKVRTEQIFSESIESIRSLWPNVKVGEAKRKYGEFSSFCSVFSNIEGQTKQNLEAQASKMAERFLPQAIQLTKSLPNVASSFKNAYIVTFGKEKC